MIRTFTPLENETYNSYIQRIIDNRGRKRSSNPNDYQEQHHILPKCLGGQDEEDNLIYLYAQEHYYAHKLLALENPHNGGLQYAWWMMSHTREDIKVSAEDYELSKSLITGENHSWYGKHHSKETLQKMSENKKGEKNPFYGHKRTEQEKQHISEVNKGNNYGMFDEFHPQAVKIRCVETGEIFNCIKYAQLWCGLKNSSPISAQLRNKRKSAGKHPETGECLHWEFV